VYWKQGDGHPGLVYNESGEVIRLGTFGDITAHLDDLKTRYQVTGIYLLGVQTRGQNREDWSPSASSPSPFSPMSLTEIESSLGGGDEFKRLVDKAHEIDIRVIVDIVPHLNRSSVKLPPEYSVRCYDESGNIVVRASTDGRYGSWNDGKLLNYRRFEVWEWFAESIETLIARYHIDGIRIDTGHALPVMMKRNNYLYTYNQRRTHEELLHGEIVVNDREDDHYVTTGYYDSACRERIACPFYTFLNGYILPSIATHRSDYFVLLAESYWGRERYLTRSGVVAYNSALFKICENITHGKTDVRELYHLYDHYYVNALPEGAVLIGIFGNHDERRALNTFGERGVRAAIGLTSFLSSTILDYEGSAEGESWKVHMDNIHVNWNQFEYASHRSLEGYYREIYAIHRKTTGPGKLLWTENYRTAAAIKPKQDQLWIGAFSFSESSENVTLHFDAPNLPLSDDTLYRMFDPVYSPVTGRHGYFLGSELRASTINTLVPYTERVKYLVLEKRPASEKDLPDVFRDSFSRIGSLRTGRQFTANLAYQRLVLAGKDASEFPSAVEHLVLPICNVDGVDAPQFLKRIIYHGYAKNESNTSHAWSLISSLETSENDSLRALGERLTGDNARGPFVFITAEADPFSKAGGLANVTYELPRQLAANGEEVYVITPRYRHGSEQAIQRMERAIERFDARYTGKNVRFYIESEKFEVGVHTAMVGNVTYFLLDHHEFFDGLYWGFTAEERLRRRVAIARAAAETILTFDIKPLFVFTNDAYTGLFHGIIRSDAYYANNDSFDRTACFHIIHNGGWQYFDAYDRFQEGKDLLTLLNLPLNDAENYCDPVYKSRINCMAAAIRFSDKCITVSPSYANQLRVAGDGLEHILSDIVGINNALATDFVQRAEEVFDDVDAIEPLYAEVIEATRTETKLESKLRDRFPELLKDNPDMASIASNERREIVVRMRNKLATQAQYGLAIDPDAPLLTMLHRVADQKGFQLLLEASQGLFANLGIQLIAGGPVAWDDEQARTLADGLQQLGTWYPDSASIHLGFHDVRMPLLASDAFLMPSRHEPGGISQLEALVCGCPVIARVTGGLRDTISQFEMTDGNLTGTGVLFTDYSAKAFYEAIDEFVTLWRSFSDAERYKARKNARSSVYYWDKSADRYVREAYGFREIIHT
jgi:starch synthase